MGRCRYLAAFFLAWVALIFATSSTVVLMQDLFAIVRKYVLTDAASRERFELFWGISWFAIVKGWHVAEFAILMRISTRLLQRWNGRASGGSVLWAALFCTAFAASDEWHQSFVPQRFGTVQDVGIDGLGILLVGLLELRRVRRILRYDADSTSPAVPSAEPLANLAHEST
jgi:hypothetical protein